jgi:cystathionine beta-lyase
VFSRPHADGGPVVYLLCSPHNPTGVVHTTEELTKVAALAEQYGVVVVANEIHGPLVPAGSDFVPYLSLPGTENALAVTSATKAWNISSFKTALAVAGRSAVHLGGIPMSVMHGVGHVPVLAQTAALTHAEDWLDDLLAGLDANRRLLADLLRTHLPEVGYRQPEGTYLAWLDCRGLLGAGTDPAKVFLEQGRVALSSGTEFGTGGTGHVRLNLATSPEILTEAVRRMASAVV